jgi:hypothetical protein
MSLLAPLVLARDVLLIPLGELDSETRAAIAGEDGDVAVTRPASRQPSVGSTPRPRPCSSCSGSRARWLTW